MKKLLALVLAVAMVFGMATMGAAATGKITGVIGAIETNRTYDFSEIRAGQVLEFPLTANMFEWSDGTKGAANDPVTTSQLSTGKVTVRSSNIDTNIITKISLATKAFPVTDNKKTAYIKVEFVESFVSTSPKDFKGSIYLAYNGNRVTDSRLTLDGTIANLEETVDEGDDYVDISGGKVLVPSAYIRELDINIGDGILIRTRVYNKQKYYGTGKEEITASDDKVLQQYDSIKKILVLETIGLNNSGNIVSLEGYEDYHVYNAQGKYLGTSNNLIPYSNKYYLSEKKIDMGGGIASSSSSASSASSSSSSSASSGSNNTNTPNASASISADTAKSKTTAAVNAAKSSGASTATVKFSNVTSISTSALTAMKNASGGLTLNLMADTMSGNAVVGRITFNPANATKDTQLGVYVDSGHTGATKSRFEKFYTNKIAVVSLGQQGSYGMNVRITAKVNLSALNINNLNFYAYNKATNSFNRITAPNYSMDANGYLRFNTSLGGDIVISDGALARR